VFSYFLNHVFDVNVLSQHVLSDLALGILSPIRQAHVFKEQIKYEFVTVRALSILKVSDHQVSDMLSLAVGRQVGRILTDQFLNSTNELAFAYRLCVFEVQVGNVVGAAQCSAEKF